MEFAAHAETLAALPREQECGLPAGDGAVVAYDTGGFLTLCQDVEAAQDLGTVLAHDCGTAFQGGPGRRQ
ncbi:hypothetical protein [Streptomyces sp. NPDC007205]|uniref:hypothetical protein n=1 Tax=Streptomyces sp. NPDC007205 TaxID=3154316 RepID=UPI0034077195